MAKQKKDNPRNLDDGEIRTQLSDLQEKLFRIRFQMAMGQMDGLKRMRVMRKDRARLLTIQRERELARKA